jgi:competence ComEA-like helix-hairpin-helix protein
MSSNLNKIAFGLACTLFLLLLTGGIILLTRTLGNQPEEITINSPPVSCYTREINISGDVLNPGIYSITDNDTILSLLDTAGIAANSDNLSILLSITENNAPPAPQKVNINTAEDWLIQSLPEIGESKAQAIIDYRNQNGGFHNIYELQQIDGISAATFEKIKDLITVGEL